MKQVLRYLQKRNKKQSMGSDKTLMKIVSVVALLLGLGVGQVWGADAEIIKVTLSGSNGADRTVTGTIGGTSAVNALSSGSPYKLNADGAYVSLTLASGYFEPTDVVTITGADKAHQIYYGTPGSGTLLKTTGVPSDGTITVHLWCLPSNQNTIYVYRAEGSSYNGKLTYMSVTRPDLALTGSTSVSYAMTKGNANVEGFVTNVNTITVASNEFTTSTLAIGANNSKDDYCGQITGHAAAYSASQYVQLGFKVADGYTFAPSGLSATIFANSTSNMKAKVVLSDGTTSIESNELSCSSSADSEISFPSGAFTDKVLSGNITVTIYQWGVTGKRAYIKSPLTITGTVAEVAAPAVGTTWYVKGGWNSWGTTDNLVGSGTELSATVNISTAGQYEFKIHDTESDAWYGNTGNIGCNVSGWVFASDKGNCKLFASETGDYTFTFNTETKAVAVTYPTAQNKFYYKNTNSWGTVAVYRYVGDKNNGWPGTQVVETETICGDTYYFTYADPGTTIIFNNNNNGSQTGNMSAAAENAGKYVAGTGNSWTAFPTYTVTYNGNGNTDGSVPTDASSPYACASTVTVLGNTGSLVKDGYDFTGWNTADNGTGEGYTAGNTFSICANTTLYAQWELKPTYTVTYNKNGDGAGGAGDVTGSVPTDATAYNSGDRAVVKGPGDLALSGKTFIGWNDAANGSGTYYSEKSNFAITANKKLYAQWRTASSCPGGEGGTVFSLSMNNKTTDTEAFAFGECRNLASYATITNGGASFTDIRAASSSGVKAYIDKANPGRLNLNGNDAMITLYLDCSLQEGDVVMFTSSADKQICFTTTPSRSTSITTTSKSYTIPAASGLIGAKTLYVWRNESNSNGVTSITITRSHATVSVTHTLTNVTKTSGETTAGGSDYTAVYAAAEGYTLPTPTVTIDGNAATSGTDYTWTAGTGTLTIPASKITGDIVITLNSAAAAPSSVTIGDNWLWFAGETLTLTATATGGNGPKTYQWYKGGKADGNAIEGETAATFTKTCAFEDAGSYYCKVTCGGTESTWGNSGNAYDVKVPRLYVKTGTNSGDKSDYGNVDFTRVDASTATASISLGANWDYCFNIADGCGHYYGNAGTMQYNNYGPWTTNVNNQDCGLRTTNGATYVFTIDYSNWSQLKTTVTYPVGNQAAGKVIYFDNSESQWTNLHYRVGRADHTQAATLTKVAGTANLYKYTTVAYDGFAGWHIANNAGWVGNTNSIYRTYTNGDEYEITYATAHEGGAVTAEAVTVTPTTSKGNGADVGINDNCEFYNYTITTGMKTDAIEIADYAHGTVTVAYTDVNNAAQSFTSGSRDLAHTVILTVTATPATGYQLSSLTINGAAHTSGNTYTASGETEIVAVFAPKTYAITLNGNGGTGHTPNVTATYGSWELSSAITNPTREGYTFRGWYNASGGTGKQVIGTSGTLNSNVTGFTDGSGNWTYTNSNSLTLVARWTQCAAYSFTYGTHGANDWASACFTQVGETNEWNIADFVIPDKPNFYVGWAEDFADADLGSNHSWSVERAWTDVPSQTDSKWQGQMVLLPTASSAVGQATGAVGTLVIWDNSADGNLYVGFKPNGYGLTYNSGTIGMTETDAGSHLWESDVVTLAAADVSGSFQVKLATSDGYVACAHGTSETASALDGRNGDRPDLASGQRGKFRMWANSATNNWGLDFMPVYEVSFDLQGYGSAISAYPSIAHGALIGAPSEPSEAGMVFVGWYKEPACTNAWDFGNDVVTGTTTLYAKWFGCPAAASGETVYKFEVNSSVDNGNICSAQNTPVNITTPTQLSALEGGTLQGKVTSSSMNNLAFSGGRITYANGSNGVLILTLQCAIEEGDLIRYNNYSSSNSKYNYLRHTSSSTSSGQLTLNASKTATEVQEVVATDDFDGKTELYIVAGSNTTGISYFEIIRPCVVTLDANTNGGTVGGENTKVIRAANGEEVVLPRAAKDGYRFKGWFAAPSGGVAVSDPYTVTAGTTLYAQFEDCPNEGMVYKFEVRTDLTTENFAETGTFEINAGNYLTSIMGGTLHGYEGNGNHYITKEATNGIKIANNAGYLKVDLDCPLRAGDVIKATVGDKTMYVTKTTTRTATHTLPVGTLQESTIPEALVGEKTIYIWRGGGTATISYFEIVRASQTEITLSAGDAYNSYTTNVTATKGTAMPEITTLPLRVGYVFGGYYDGVGGTGTQYYNGLGGSARNWDKDDATTTLYAKWMEPCEVAPTLTTIAPMTTMWDQQEVDMSLVKLSCDFDTTGIHYSLKSASEPITGCTYSYFDEHIYIQGIPNLNNASTVEKTITFTITNDCTPATEYYVTAKVRIHPKDQKPKLAYIITGTKNGGWDAFTASDRTNSLDLLNYLDDFYDITCVNGYKTKDSATLADYYKDYDLLIVTDFLNTGEGYTNAIGMLIDKMPILSFEAYVAKQSNWHIGSDPNTPSKKVGTMKVTCAGHTIFKDEEYMGTPVDVVAADTTINVLSSISGNGLQGFAINEAPDFIFLATIRDTSKTRDLVVSCERQVVFQARLLLYGINFNEMGNLTPAGKIVMKQMIDYLLMTNETKVADCSLIFDNHGGDKLWSNPANWAPGYNILPTAFHPTRIVAECHVDVDDAHAGSVKINKGRDEHNNPVDGKLIIEPTGGLTIAGLVTKVNDTRYASPVVIREDELLIKANATHNGALVYGNKESDVRATVQYYSRGSGARSGSPVWQYIGIPFQVGHTAISMYRDAWMCRWSAASTDGIGGNWEWVDSYDVLLPFEGYCITQANTKTYEFAGKLNLPVTTTVSLDNCDDDGYAFVANSWTAPIKIQEMTTSDFTNAEASIYIYHSGSYADWTANGEPVNAKTGSVATLPGQYAVIPVNSSPYLAGADSVIPAMQGFFVKRSAEDAKLTLEYNRVVYDAKNFKTSTQAMRAPQRHATANEEIGVMQLMVSAEHYGDRVHMLARTDFSEEFENGWDGRKIAGDEGAPMLAVVKESGEMAVAAVAEMAEHNLMFRAGQDTEYTFSFEYEGEPLYLYDRLTGISTLINKENTYTFTATNKTPVERFLITADPPGVSTGIGDVQGDDGQSTKAVKFIHEDKLMILYGGAMYDALGTRVNNGKEGAK